MTIYKVSYSQQINLLAPMLLKNLAVVALMIIVRLGEFATVLTLLIVFLIDILPTLIIHIQYLTKNWKNTLTIDRRNRVISLERDAKINRQSLEDITAVNRYLSYVRSTGWHSFGPYRYYKINFKDGTEYIITCLMIEDIESNLGEILPFASDDHFRVMALIY